MIETDILIIGAGPTGLFTVFEAGLLKLRCHLIDSLAKPGGQLVEIYPKKPIYDIPGHPKILAGDLVHNLMEQIKPFKPGFTMGERAESLEKMEDGRFKLTTQRGKVLVAPVLAIAGGLGCFEPRKPPIDNIEDYEDNGVDYIVRDPEKYRGEKVVIAGGGDSALDWAIFLADVAAEVVLVHRRSKFRGAPDSVEKVKELSKKGHIEIVTNAQVVGLEGKGILEGVVLREEGKEDLVKEAAYFIPLFGLSPKLGPISEWGLNIENNAIEVDPKDYSTNVPGIFAIGDINTYPGKLKLILCGFHEATLMSQAAFRFINPEQKPSLKYTTVTGVTGFDE